jgi:hypothetical protein
VDRYLTKICDQVVALLSADHSASLVLSDGNDDSDNGDSGDSERLFTFEVAETIQQESAVSCPGFQVMPQSTNFYDWFDLLTFHR